MVSHVARRSHRIGSLLVRLASCNQVGNTDGMFDILMRYDHGLFRLINQRLGCDWLDPVFGDLSTLGSWMIALVALAWLADSGRLVFWRHVLALTLALTLVGAVSQIVKQTVGRPRPVVTLTDARMVERAIPESRSFPSGHAMAAFFFMTYVALARQRGRFWALLLATAVAFSRVYVGAHFPSDVLAGSALGALGGWLGWMVFRWLDRERAPDSRTLTAERG